jgi:transcriptional repressor NrdR
MRCPRCGHQEDRVIDSRAVRDGKGVRRRRECLDCGHRFTTYEYVDAVALLVVKRDGRREAYQRDKVKRGILRAVQKRPVSADELEAILDRTETRLHHLARGEVETREIGSLVMAELRRLDPVAYVRFASVYHRFGSVQEFVEIVEGIAGAGHLMEPEDPAGAQRSTPDPDEGNPPREAEAP